MKGGTVSDSQERKFTMKGGDHMAVRTAESSREEILPSWGCPRAPEGMGSFSCHDKMTRVCKICSLRGGGKFYLLITSDHRIFCRVTADAVGGRQKFYAKTCEGKFWGGLLSDVRKLLP